LTADPGCLFCRIVSGREQAEVVLDEDGAVAFLDYRPVFPGHCLLVPRDHYETLGDLPEDVLGMVFATAQRLARAVERGMDADGTFVAMNNRVSQSVPHFHVHVVPRRRKDGLRGFFWPRLKYGSDEERREVAERLRVALGAVP
jgi:histidine triad (HIT) family protein